VKKADELGLAAYTEASPKGLGLYLRYEFEEVDFVTVDLEPWAGRKGRSIRLGFCLEKRNALRTNLPCLHRTLSVSD
jgi:hypothetical protein